MIFLGGCWQKLSTVFRYPDPQQSWCCYVSLLLLQPRDLKREYQYWEVANRCSSSNVVYTRFLLKQSANCTFLDFLRDYINYSSVSVLFLHFLLQVSKTFTHFLPTRILSIPKRLLAGNTSSPISICQRAMGLSPLIPRLSIFLPSSLCLLPLIITASSLYTLW